MNKHQLKQKIREQGYTNFKFGNATQVMNLCREIRICMPNEVGKVYDGFDTDKNERQYWVCVKATKFIPSNIMQRIYIKE